MVSLRLFSFISSVYLFLGASAGMLLSWVFLVSPRPWSIDVTGNQSLFLGNTLRGGITVEQWLATLKSDVHGDAASVVKEILLAQYRFSALVFLLASLLMVFIVFLAPRNRVLNLLTHFGFMAWLIVFGVVMRPLSHDSIHSKFYFSMLIFNIIGTVSYVFYLHKVQILIKERKEKELKPPPQSYREHQEEKKDKNQ
ncbi:lipid A export ATP-binding/permease protein MsbA [Acrasis kona]|uniref:Lipid A export ATP-binding/permease protein MsbA n=1 Tax=Acrasis kona TaxID=1008807 RepID=A0AAW2ZMG7_9EUKA